MATPRKTGASRPKAKPAKPARSAAPKRASARPVASRAGGAKGAAKTAKPVVKGARKPVAPAKTGAGKPVPVARGKVVPAKPGAARAVAGKGGAVKPAAAGQDGKRLHGKPVIRVVSHGPVAEARPIGALPPDAVARAVKGHAPVASKPRPSLPTRDTKPSSGAEGVSEKDFKEFEQRLIAERQKIMKDMGYLESNVLKVNQRDSAGDLSGYSFHMADVGTDAYEREKAFLFASSEGRLLMDIDDALRKLYRGEYGRCEICEQPIARARLEAMPYARLCLACKEKQERENRGAL